MNEISKLNFVNCIGILIVGFPRNSQFSRNSCVVLHEITFLREIPHHFRINTKPVLHEIAHSFEINKFSCTKFRMNTKFKPEFVHDIRMNTGHFCM